MSHPGEPEEGCTDGLLELLFGVDSDLHSLQNLDVFVCEIKRCRTVCFLTGVGAQADLKAQRQFHLVTRVSQTLDRICHLRRVLHRLVYRGSYLANNLFGVVVNFQLNCLSDAELTMLKTVLDMLRDPDERGQHEVMSCRWSLSNIDQLEFGSGLNYLNAAANQ